jgi:CRISPR-associated endonuclease Csn1
MTISLGLDIGSNSVGSAWVDTETRIVEMAVSVFPAGVEESEAKRGNPVNQKRRAKRQQRRSLARRSRRKRRLV